MREFFGAILGLSYLPQTKVVSVSAEFLHKLSQLLYSSQVTHHHLPEREVDDSCTAVIVVDDLRKISSSASVTEQLFCIEWKPKYVLLPRSRLIPLPISKYKYRYYRCNLKQNVPEGSNLKSCYHPPDIFSFETDRVRTAFVSLLRCRSKYLQLLHPIETEPLASSILETNLDILVEIIRKEACLLMSLRKIQQLDILDYYGAKLALEKLHILNECTDLEKLERRVYEKTASSGWLEEELEYLNGHGDIIFHSDEEEEQTKMQWCLDKDSAKLEESFHRARSYLLSLSSAELERFLGDFLYSTIMKDCSIIITFKASEDSDFSSSDKWKTLSMGQRTYYYSISIIDLEPKSLKKLNTWLENDEFLFLSL